MAEPVVVVTSPTRKPAQRVMRALSPRSASCSRGSAWAFTTSCSRVIMAEVLAFTAASLATLTWRIMST